MGPYIERWKNALSKYVNENDTVLTAEEAGEWASEVKKSFSSVNDNLKSYAQALEAEGIDLYEGGGEMSGLQAGISGITEEQANILEAYWNAVRMSAASIDSKMDIANSFMQTLMSNDVEANPILAELTLIRANTGLIREALDSVIASGSSHSQGGKGLKVFIDS
jgi:hypothetical protein